jgi:spore maturation protein CgeB
LNSLKNKKILLASWGCKVKTSQECRDWPPVFKKIFRKVIFFSLKNEYYYYGKEILNRKFLNILKKEKPDYLLYCPNYDEFYFETLKKIKEINPKIKIVMWFGDDDLRFDDWSRYYSLFSDYILTTKKEISIYKKDKIKNASFMIGVNTNYHRSLDVDKIYDVTFIGKPIVDRYDYIKFLMKKGINIKLFGGDWHNYSDLKDIYGGFLSQKDFIKVINQSKINLNFSKVFFKKNDPGCLKGRSIEILACNSFLLTEYTKMNISFISGKNGMNFRNKEELLKKIKYYLKYEEERKNLTKEAYNHILKNYSWENLFTKYFEKIEKDKSMKKDLPKLNKKIIKISKKEINLSLKEIKDKLKNIDYISFFKSFCKQSPYKNYFQAYSLKISKKQISCCDYNVYSKDLGNYLIFSSKKAFNSLNKKDFQKLLNMDQLMVTKDYFLKNFNAFKKIFNGEFTNIINKKDIVFVSIPLVSFTNINSIKYKNMKEIFRTLFFDKIFSLAHQKKIFDPYLFKLFFLPFPGKKFAFKYLLERFFDKGSWEALNYFS